MEHEVGYEGKSRAQLGDGALGFLYVLNDCNLCPNQIFGFAVDETTGALTPLTNAFPVLTGGNGTNNSRGELLAIDRNNLRLFAINDSSNTVSVFAIDPATGGLTRMFEKLLIGEPHRSDRYNSH